MRDAVIVLCSRPESKRLPGKVFRPLGGSEAIQLLLGRLGLLGLPVILAVPRGCSDYDQWVAHYREHMDIRLFKGHPESPLHRSWEAVCSMEQIPKWMIRVTHDDLLIDTETALQLLDECEANPACGYGISPSIVEGAGIEVIRVANLQRAAETRQSPTEYISYFVKGKPFSETVVVEPRASIRRPYRLTMDYYEDWLVLDTILSQTGVRASLDDICRFIDLHPHVMGWNRQPDVTFYTCVRDGGRFVAEAMRSVLRQTGVNLEYIVVDDGSGDDTAVFVSEFSEDRRLRFYKNQHALGLASASNFAISQARGRYIMRVDADDVLTMGAPEKMIAAMIADKSVAVYAAYSIMGEKADMIKYKEDPRFAHHAGCALFDRRFLNELRFTDGLKHFDGMDLYLRMKDRAERISYIDNSLWYYRRHAKNLSGPANREERMKAKEDLGICSKQTATSVQPEAPGAN